MQGTSTQWRLFYAINIMKAAEILAVERGDDDAHDYNSGRDNSRIHNNRTARALHDCNNSGGSGVTDDQRTAVAIYTIVIMTAAAV